ncbi:uncharacterized protein EV154DRAFT_532368, partial [Mucor mucedo]|uniref:uncharacterized protein n=1 Tax=Mucor mucedo TaxID=29922 RepID=UPI00221E698B
MHILYLIILVNMIYTGHFPVKMHPGVQFNIGRPLVVRWPEKGSRIISASSLYHSFSCNYCRFMYNPFFKPYLLPYL